MTEGYLCDRCETFHEDLDRRSEFTTTVEASGYKKEGVMGEESTWDLCPDCASYIVEVIRGEEPEDETAEQEVEEKVDADEEDQEDDADTSTNPYEPSDLGTFQVRERDGRVTGAVELPRRVGQHFDADVDRVHVRQSGDRFELVRGEDESWPHYAICRKQDAKDGEVSLGAEAVELLDVVPGDEVRAEPDGDVVVLEPNRIADRSQEEFLGRYEVRDYGSPMLPLTGDARTHFLEQDADRVSVLERDGEVYVVPGEKSDWPDYAVSTQNISLGRPAVELLDAEEGDTIEAVATPDGVRLDVLDHDRAGDAEVEEGGEALQASTDGGVASANATSAGGPGRECKNCGSHVTERYAAVNSREGEEDPPFCPNCDMVEEADGTVRMRRDKGQHK